MWSTPLMKAGWFLFLLLLVRAGTSRLHRTHLTSTAEALTILVELSTHLRSLWWRTPTRAGGRRPSCLSHSLSAGIALCGALRHSSELTAGDSLWCVLLLSNGGVYAPPKPAANPRHQADQFLQLHLAQTRPSRPPLRRPPEQSPSMTSIALILCKAPHTRRLLPSTGSFQAFIR